MTSLEMANLSVDIEKLCEEYKTHPAVLLFQPRDSRKMFVMFVGNPSIEWISKAGEGYAKKLEEMAVRHEIKGT